MRGREQMCLPVDASLFCPGYGQLAVYPVPPEWSYESIAMSKGITSETCISAVRFVISPWRAVTA